MRIVVLFDAITFNGGLGLLGIQSKKIRGVQHYTIKHYQDLNPILGKNWHFRVLNVNADYGYVVLETVDFYLWKWKNMYPVKLKSKTVVNHHRVCHLLTLNII